MATLNEIVSFLDSELRIKEVPDYQGAMNGLQMEGQQKVTQVAVAVDASLPVMRKAADSGANILIVHHGMFWNGARRVTGATYEKFRLAIEAGLAVYSAHIPLDIHPVIGNNACLVSALELEKPEPFFEWKGILLGIRGRFTGSLKQLVSQVGKVLGEEPHVCSAGSEEAGVESVLIRRSVISLPQVGHISLFIGLFSWSKFLIAYFGKGCKNSLSLNSLHLFLLRV